MTGKDEKEAHRLMAKELPASSTLAGAGPRERTSTHDSMEAIFTEIYESNAWASDESASGLGSELSYTEELRARLPELFEIFDIRSILDAPCGDFNWIRHVVARTGVTYVGADIVPALVEMNASKWSRNNVSFVRLNICTDELPKCDLWFCRDCLFHIPFKEILASFENFVASGIRFLLTTTHINESNWVNQDVGAGGFRYLDLFSAPFCLPRSVKHRIRDYVEPFPPREMVLFERAQIADALPAMRAAIDQLKASPAKPVAPDAAVLGGIQGSSTSSYGRWSVTPPNLPRIARAESPSQAFDRAAIQRLLQGIGTELLFGGDPDAAIRRIESWGAPAEEARRIVQTAVSDPLIVNGREMALMLRRRDWLLDSLEKLQQLSPRAKSVERRTELSGGEFLEFYYARNRPVVIHGEMAKWRAPAKWTLPFLQEAAGLPPGGAGLIAATDASTTELAMDSPAFAPLAGDLGPLDKFLERGSPTRDGLVRIAREGAFVPLRSALRNTLLAQIAGRSRLKLVAAADAAKIYSRDGVASEIADLEAPARDLARFPLLAGARVHEVLLEPGEILFVPLGWWHQSRALDFGVVARYIAFRWPNDMDRGLPQPTRPERGAAA